MPPLLKDKFSKDVKQTTMDGGGSPTPPAKAPTIQQIQQAVQGAQNINAAIDKAAAQNEANAAAGTGLTPNTATAPAAPPATAPTIQQIQQAAMGAQNINAAIDKAAAQNEANTAAGTGLTTNTVTAPAAPPATAPTLQQIQQAVSGNSAAVYTVNDLSAADKANLTPEQQAAIVAAKNQWAAANAAGDAAGKAAANAAAEAIRAQAGYSGGTSGSGYNPLSTAPSTSTGTATPGLPTTLPGSTMQQVTADGDTGAIRGSVSNAAVPSAKEPTAPSTSVPVTLPSGNGQQITADGEVAGIQRPPMNIGAETGGTTTGGSADVPTNLPSSGDAQTGTDAEANTVPNALPTTSSLPTYRADIDGLRGNLQTWRDSVEKQKKAAIDYAVQQAVAELQRAEQNAQGQFKEQAESVALDERQGMDNAALYAEARGDKGGIGLAQYNEIQAAAAQNRLSVQQAQTKLSTDTARQIADLRAKGEFDKADALLEVSQTYLTQLMQLEQWAANYGLNVEQFKQSLDQWQKEYDLAVDKFTESKNQYNQQNAIELGKAMLNAGIPVDDATLKAMNMTREQADAWMLAAQMGATSNGGNGSTSELGQFNSLSDMYAALKQAGVNTEEGVTAHLRSWGIKYPEDFSDDYLNWLDGQTGSLNANPPKGSSADEHTTIINMLKYKMGMGELTPAQKLAELELQLMAGNITEDEYVALAESAGL